MLVRGEESSRIPPPPHLLHPQSTIESLEKKQSISIANTRRGGNVCVGGTSPSSFQIMATQLCLSVPSVRPQTRKEEEEKEEEEEEEENRRRSRRRREKNNTITHFYFWLQLPIRNFCPFFSYPSLEVLEYIQNCYYPCHNFFWD